MPIGIPGWPEFAACTASIASARKALAMSRSIVSWEEMPDAATAAVVGVFMGKL